MTLTQGWPLLLSLALPLEVEVQIQVQAEAKAEARVVVDTGTNLGFVAQQYFDRYLSDTPIGLWEEANWLSLVSSSFTASNGPCLVALQDTGNAIC